jgi:tRNA U34 5-methylaminomethyl-2-thiouridine-forming methyltransferase MnmC
MVDEYILTADGSKTLYNAAVGEHYHSKHGALQESLHVFLGQGLQYFLQQQPTNNVSILEVGFGTGLNFLLTANWCQTQHIGLNYTGIEAYPLSANLIAQSGYQQYVNTALWQAFNQHYPAALQQSATLSPSVNLHIAHQQLLQFSAGQLFDVVYFDAFAAIHQPEMWNDEAIGHTLQFLKPGGVFVAYAITGNLKRMLKALNCDVQKAPGAPGKREMLRAVKQAFATA